MARVPAVIPVVALIALSLLAPWARGAGGGEPVPVLEHPMPLLAFEVKGGAVIADLSGDGTPEFALYLRPHVLVYSTNGSLLLNVTAISSSYFVADADNDGREEIVFYSEEENGTEIQLVGLEGTEEYWVNCTGRPAVADLDSDGESEVLIVSGKSVSVFEVSGDVMALKGNTSLPIYAEYFAVGDVLSDRGREIVISDCYDVAVLNSSLDVVELLEFGGGIRNLWIADCDYDGIGEVLVIFDAETRVVDLRDNRSSSYPVSAFYGVADVDSDGFPEPILYDGHTKESYYLENGSLMMADIPRKIGKSVERIAFGDFDADGETELITDLGWWLILVDSDGASEAFAPTDALESEFYYYVLDVLCATYGNKVYVAVVTAGSVGFYEFPGMGWWCPSAVTDPGTHSYDCWDYDLDFLPDRAEGAHGCDPRNPDTDGDGMPDGYEVLCGLNPTRADGDGDSDGDGVANLQEYKLGLRANSPDTDRDWLPDGNELVISCDPRSPDTDGDGMPDGWEYVMGTDPLAPDGDEDYDGDGLANYKEYLLGTDPRKADTDGDMIPDGVDYAPLHKDNFLLLIAVILIAAVGTFVAVDKIIGSQPREALGSGR